MSLILDGTSGLSDVDGTAAAPAIRGTDTNTGIFFPAADTIAFSEGGVEAMRIDASGNVGIGTSSPNATSRATILSSGTSTSAFGNVALRLSANGSGYASTLVFSDEVANSAGISMVSGALAFGTSGYNTERARIDSSGNLLVGTTSTALATSGFSVQPAGNGANIPFAYCSGAASSTQITWAVYSNTLAQYQFYANYAGTVFARSTSISALSDQREKENVRPLETGLTEVMALQPRRFDWKNGSASNVAGFIAQEVQVVLPDLIDEYKINDQETRMAVKMGDILPTLVKAIQEQQTLITALTARITALEAPIV